MHGLWTRLRMRRLHAAALVGLVAALTLAIVAIASHPEVSLPGSNFEIDTDANLKVDDAAPSIDWASVTEARQADLESGSGDDSFGQGTKEDTAVPTVVDGSIPPQKSDLLNFGVYLETVGNQSFLNLFWHRVQEPNGTTNMDFEFNQSSTISANGKTPVRTAGDLLIQYDLAQGGTNPQLFLSRWVTSGAGSLCEASNSTPCWGARVNLSAAGDAAGSINTSAIPAAESDGLGSVSPRTFGEAQLDFDALTGGGCVGFGSAYLKSRSSDSFTAAVKDFIAPKTLNLNTCGAIEITKTRKHAAAGSGPHPHAGVTFTITGPGLPAAGTTVVTDAQGKACLGGLQAGNYTVTETVPSGYHATGGTTSKSVTVDSVGTCLSGPETVSFSNIPLSDITVSFSSQVTGGTASTIACTGLTAVPPDTTPSLFDDTSETFKDLEPGTYTCTVVVDP
jgi:Prealbumin-like fold domain